jgi:hypothetical protein
LSSVDSAVVTALLKNYEALNITAGGHVMIGSPGSVQATTVVFKRASKPAITVIHPEGSIGSDLSARNYIRHLIERYQSFASQQAGRKYNYAVVYKSIERTFGAKLDLIPVKRFEDVAALLQRKIDGTQFGRNNRKAGRRNYSTYDEYRTKYETASREQPK